MARLSDEAVHQINLLYVDILLDLVLIPVFGILVIRLKGYNPSNGSNINDFILEILLLVCGGIFLFATLMLISRARSLKRIHLDYVDAFWQLNGQVNEYVYDKVEDRFHIEGRPVRTKNGALRVSFRNAMEAEKQSLERLVTEEDGSFTKEFASFVQNNFPNARRCDTQNIFESYLADLERQAEEIRDRYLRGGGGFTPQEFRMRTSAANFGDFVGVYVLFNEWRNKAYVGQSKKVIQRVKQHLSGRGNGDAYADMKNGDSFKIFLYPLKDSGYYDIDEFEKSLILLFHANTTGYNRTQGNG